MTILKGKKRWILLWVIMGNSFLPYQMTAVGVVEQLACLTSPQSQSCTNFIEKNTHGTR